MSQFIHSYPVDLAVPKTTKIQTQTLFITQDNMADRIQAVVRMNGEDYTISGGVSAYIMLGDGTTVAVSPAGKSGNVAYVDLPQAAYAVPGVIVITLKETDDGTVTSLLQVVGTVKKSQTGVIVEPGDPIPSVADEIADLDSRVTTLENASTSSVSVSGTTLVFS